MRRRTRRITDPTEIKRWIDMQNAMHGTEAPPLLCPACEGRGRSENDEDCSSCNGTGDGPGAEKKTP